jgi:hypothetical protein
MSLGIFVWARCTHADGFGSGPVGYLTILPLPSVFTVTLWPFDVVVVVFVDPSLAVITSILVPSLMLNVVFVQLSPIGAVVTVPP